MVDLFILGNASSRPNVVVKYEMNHNLAKRCPFEEIVRIEVSVIILVFVMVAWDSVSISQRITQEDVSFTNPSYKSAESCGNQSYDESLTTHSLERWMEEREKLLVS
jgi:hypothetical protein